MQLDFYPELQQGINAVVEIDEADLDDGSWNHCLVGHFLDGKMAFPLLSSTTKYVWGKKGLKIVRLLDSIFIFEFEDEDSKLQALENGPISFHVDILSSKSGIAYWFLN